MRAALALPFVVALIALATTHWSPVLDLAMTELRVRDVFGPHTPLIGLPGRIGTFPEQGSHPGPLSFYLLAPVYRLLGSTAYALFVATAVINVGAAWTAVWVAQRRGGRRLVLGVGAVLMVLMAWLGASVLTQPWNPYLPLVSFVVVLLSAWAVLDGDHLMLVPLVAALHALRADPRAVPLAVRGAVRGRVRRGRLALVARAVGESWRSEVGDHLCGGRGTCCGCRCSSTRSAATRATSRCCAGTSSTRRSRRWASERASRRCWPTSMSRTSSRAR